MDHRSNSSSSEQEDFPLEALNSRWQLFLTILYSLTAVVSFILNVTTIIVLARGKRNTSELRKYLINLSVSDLLLCCFNIPFTYTEYMLGRWIFPAFMCPMVRFVVTLSVFVSVATMTVIGINRHIAVMFPFKKTWRPQAKIFNKSMIIIPNKSAIILLVWLIGIVISLPEYLTYTLKPFKYNNTEYHECAQLWPYEMSAKYTIGIYLITFVIPLLLLCYLYSKICMKIWKHQMPGNADVIRDYNQHMVRVKVIKMLAVVVIVFAVSWLPLQTFTLIITVYPKIREATYNSTKYNIFVACYFVFHWLSMAHSCLNPFIYCFMNENFEADLRSVCFHDSSTRTSGTETTVCHNESHTNNSKVASNVSNIIKIQPKPSSHVPYKDSSCNI